MGNGTCDISTYMCYDRGMILPLVNEYTWSQGARAFVYLLGLLWSFMGVSIIADIFMQGIETITSKATVIKIPDPDSEDEYQEIEVKTWNGTVANLTLMALGSSAPEILLSLIEVIGNGFISGELGPSTIVGSAAFNLMCITGICIIAIPEGESRRIRHFKVFIVTAVFCVFAYVWLIIILMVITPDYIDVWEAVVTFLLFPILVILAYIADKDYCGRRPVDDESKLELGGQQGTASIDEDADLRATALPFIADGFLYKNLASLNGRDNVNLLDKKSADRQLITEMLKRLRHEKDVADKDFAQLASHLMEGNKSHDRGWYRINAIRELTGGTQLNTPMNKKTEELLEALLIEENTGSSESFLTMSEGGKKAIVEFAATSTAVMEKDGHAHVCLIRHGNLHKRVLIRVETIDGTAEAESDYKPYKETLVFEPEETCKQINLEIIDDNVWEPDEVFFVRITCEPDQPVVIGKRSITQVVILNDDDPGVLEFENPSYVYKESVGKALIPVTRHDGADGKVTVTWKAKDLTAIAGRDYENTSGVLEFEHGEMKKMIEILINDDQEFEKDENFEVSLKETTGGAKLGKLKRAVIRIVNDDEYVGFVSRITELTNANLDSLRMQKQTWGEQFAEAMNVNGGDLENATAFAYVMHFLTFGWKAVFALVPPPTIFGGWLCFIVALVFIGLLTAFIGDLASIFGCLIGLDGSVTAITFVALGTSLPDLFASKKAATMEKYADNSIGNVTGSNSVNVFLGLGMSWLVAALYWSAQGKTFEVPAGSLGFSVTLYTLCSLVTIGVLLMRRTLPVFGKAELGGPRVTKLLCGIFLIFLWIFYVLLSSLQVYEYIPGF